MSMMKVFRPPHQPEQREEEYNEYLKSTYQITVGVPIELNKAPTNTGTHSTNTDTLVSDDRKAGN